MTIFIAGSTGYTGQALVELSCTKEIPCIAHIRPESQSLLSKSDKYTSLGATIASVPWTEADITRVLLEHAPTHIFSLLGTTKKNNQKEQSLGRAASYKSVDRDLTLLLYNAAAKMPTPPVFVYLSSFGADKPNGAYLAARYEVEQVITQGTLPYFIARPGFITGPDREEFRALERSAAIISDGLLKGLSTLGWKNGFQQYGSLSSTQLATGLLHFALQESPNKTLYTKDLRLS
jgi:nucleoside-diphosphate-sugar epimerase